MNPEPLRVLIIDDEPFHAEAVAESLQRMGHACVVATSGKQGAALIDDDDFDVVVTDLKMDGVDGMTLLRKARQEQPDAAVILITGHGDVKTAVEAMQQGALHYLTKPVDMKELRAVVAQAGEKVQMARANRELRRQIDEKFGFEGFVGNSPKMREIVENVKKYAPTAVTVLVQGETGTGKELVAKAIHTNSPRKAKPFVAMNCTAINENLLEDELFGHEPGSFTGADRLRKGRFEHANGGTLFLDEVGDMPLSLQAKLLRVLENKEVFRIGSNEPIKVNVRLVSATHRDLEAAVASGAFRQDLYFRLKVATVKLPPLRERREDIPLLTAHFVKEFNHLHGKHVTDVAAPLRKMMATFDWPGNVRQLRNLVETMVVQDTDGVLDLDDLQEGDALSRLGPTENHAPGPNNLVGKPLSDVERYYIEQALDITNGNREEAARMLGIGERTLYRVIQDWKLQDKIRAALDANDRDLERTAEQLAMRPAALERKVKKWGWQIKNDRP